MSRQNHQVSDAVSVTRSMNVARAELLTMLRDTCGEEVSDWLSSSVSSISNTLNEDHTFERLSALLNPLFLESRRRCSRRHLVLEFARRDQASLLTSRGAVPLGHWRRDEAARVWIVAELLARVRDAADVFDTLYQVYDAADTEGRVACLRALNFLEGETESGLKMIHDAGRTYLNELMEAGWCHSPFASAHLSDEEYRKAVLKALFCQVPVDGFLGLEARADAELSRSLCEYANERDAAGRVVPSSVLRVASFYPQPGLVARLIGRLEHPSVEERLTAAIGLGRARDERALSFISERLEREEHPEVRDALTEALEKVNASARAPEGGEHA